MTTYSVNVFRSCRWPGAITAQRGNKYTSIYVGYGIKKGDTCFNPTVPPLVWNDPMDQKEQPEPTPLEEPVAVEEKDTDNEEGEENE